VFAFTLSSLHTRGGYGARSNLPDNFDPNIGVRTRKPVLQPDKAHPSKPASNPSISEPVSSSLSVTDRISSSLSLSVEDTPSTSSEHFNLSIPVSQVVNSGKGNAIPTPHLIHVQKSRPLATRNGYNPLTRMQYVTEGRGSRSQSRQAIGAGSFGRPRESRESFSSPEGKHTASFAYVLTFMKSAS
jgi:hypothetical protein